jgi:acyl-CoA thioesterase-1
LRRLAWALKAKPTVVVVALGANDGLRGLDVAQTRDNLRQIIRRCRAAGSRVLLAGMRLPTSMGADYRERFEGIFRQLAQEESVPLMPFLLEGVAGRSELNQTDGVHPTSAGHRIIAAAVLTALEQP